VDDEDSILTSLKRLLSREPYTTVLAKSGPEAIEHLEKESFSVLLTDHRMPRMTGMELIQHVRVSSPNTIRMMLSGQADIQEVMQALENNDISLFLKKPWDGEKLKVALRQGIEQYEHEKRVFSLLEHIDLQSARELYETSWLIEDQKQFPELYHLAWSMAQGPVPALILDQSLKAIFLNQAARIVFPSIADFSKAFEINQELQPGLIESIRTFINSEEQEAETTIFSGKVLLQKIGGREDQELYGLYYYAQVFEETFLVDEGSED
jgi:YesN/AraC family two-component response regulator